MRRRDCLGDDGFARGAFVGAEDFQIRLDAIGAGTPQVLRGELTHGSGCIALLQLARGGVVHAGGGDHGLLVGVAAEARR